MKVKTSITLSEELLAQVDRTAEEGAESRSALIERVLGEHFRRRERARIHERDLERLNRCADGLNREAGEVLEYQSWPGE